MVKIEGLSSDEIERRKETRRLAEIVKEITGPSYEITALNHIITVSCRNKFLDHPISILTELRRVDVTEPDVFDDAYRIAERLEKETGREYTVAKNYEEI